MKDQYSEFLEFLKTPFPHLFIIASFAISAVLFTGADFIKSVHET